MNTIVCVILCLFFQFWIYSVISDGHQSRPKSSVRHWQGTSGYWPVGGGGVLFVVVIFLVENKQNTSTNVSATSTRLYSVANEGHYW